MARVRGSGRGFRMLLVPILAFALHACSSGETAAPTGTRTQTTSPSAASARESLAGAGLLRELRTGGFVIFFRHAATEPGTDTDLENLENCTTQRNLSEEGRAQSREIGSAFRELEIRIGRVLSSALCRTRDTAMLAFGRAEESVELTSLSEAETDAEEERRVEALRQMLATPPPEGRNTVLVSHLFHIQRAADISLAEGEAVVVRPGGGAFTVVAALSPDEWAMLGR
jgi:phosphohistidine phosphatase SixA